MKRKVVERVRCIQISESPEHRFDVAVSRNTEKKFRKNVKEYGDDGYEHKFVAYIPLDRENSAVNAMAAILDVYLDAGADLGVSGIDKLLHAVFMAGRRSMI